MPDIPDESLYPFEAEKRQRTFILRVIRVVFLLLIVGTALLTILQAGSQPNTGQLTVNLAIQWWIPVGVAICLFLIAYLIDHYTPNKKISTISGVFLGILAGMLAAVALGFVIDLVLETWLNKTATEYLQPLMGTIKVMLGMCLCYLGVTTVLQTQDEFRLVIPYVEFAKQIRGVRPVLLDTSALIDARIADVAATGLIQAPLVVPRFVLGELQLLADSSDKLKRAKGRRGLDVVARLQRQGTIDVKIDDTTVTALAVDQMLVELAQRLAGARILTTDLALTRVGQIRGVQVLNLHEIANAFKPTMLPGQQVLLRLVKPGEQPGQAVGYLEDGTMVVAENALHRLGSETLLMVTGTMQTTAGRLVFARPIEPDEGGEASAVDAAPDSDLSRAGMDAASADADAAAGAEAAAVEPLPARPGETAERGVGQGGQVGQVAARTGPFPPKPPVRRTGTPRNPRR